MYKNKKGYKAKTVYSVLKVKQKQQEKRFMGHIIREKN